MGDGMTSQAMQQGGMGMILTTLIITAPPMAAMFFQGTLGGFMAYSQIGGAAGNAQPGPQGQPAGSVPEAPGGSSREADPSKSNGQNNPARMSTPLSDPAGTSQSTGKYGAANSGSN